MHCALIAYTLKNAVGHPDTACRYSIQYKQNNIPCTVFIPYTAERVSMLFQTHSLMTVT